MKKSCEILSLMLVVSVVICACSTSVHKVQNTGTPQPEPACTETPVASVSSTPIVTPSPTPTPYIYIDAEAIELDEVMIQASDRHRERLETAVDYKQLLEYIPDDPSARALLTRDEIAALKERREFTMAPISYEDAVADVDLYFRALKYAYALYYYFGGDAAFDAAKASVLSDLDGKTSISPDGLSRMIYGSLDFIRDVHCQISGLHFGETAEQRYEYFFTAETQEFSKDELGLYKETITGERWYFDSFTNSEADLEITLNADGYLVYSPVLFCPTPKVPKHDSIILISNGETRTEAVTWVESEAFAREAFHDESGYCFLSDDRVCYQSIRSFSPMHEQDFKSMVSDIKAAKSADALIMDIRSNGGGDSAPSGRWMKSFCGRDAVLNCANAGKATPLENGIPSSIYGREHYRYDINKKGKFIKNDVPIFVLVDDLCGSAGESMLLNLYTLDRTLIIGSNSAGYQIGGNNLDLTLPKSGIAFSFATGIRFNFGLENVDAIGYEPDIWCNPRTAASAVTSMLNNYGLIDDDSAAFLYQNQLDYNDDATQYPQQLEDSSDQNQLTLLFEGDTVYPDDGFGAGAGSYYITVMYNDAPATDYTVDKNSNLEVCSVSIVDDGRLRIAAGVPGDSYITITHHGESFTFRWCT